jgi:hypothetical protein
MSERLVVNQRVQLVACNGATYLWMALMLPRKTIAAKRVRGRIVLCEKDGNFRVKVGIQTADVDEEVMNAPVSPANGTGVGAVSSVSKVFVNFDPNGATEGAISGKDSYRLGVFWSSTDATVSRGDVLVQLWVEE